MAHPGLLVETIADALGVPRQTVIQHDRELAASGYRRKGGRGRSAVHVTTDDAANLLIAVVAAPVSGPVVKETVATFERYAFLPAWKEMYHEPADWSELKVLSELSKGHNLSSALSAIIRGYSNGDFAKVDNIWRSFAPSTIGDPGHVSVQVHIEGPTPAASIAIRGHRDFPRENAEETVLAYHEDFLIGHNGTSGLVRTQRVGDLGQIRTFSDYTLHAIAKLFSRQPHNKK